MNSTKPTEEKNKCGTCVWYFKRTKGTGVCYTKQKIVRACKNSCNHYK